MSLGYWTMESPPAAAGDGRQKMRRNWGKCRVFLGPVDRRGGRELWKATRQSITDPGVWVSAASGSGIFRVSKYFWFSDEWRRRQAVDNRGISRRVTIRADVVCDKLHCTALHCTALHCTALHCTALHRTALHCTALHCTALHCTVRLQYSEGTQLN